MAEIPLFSKRKYKAICSHLGDVGPHFNCITIEIYDGIPFEISKLNFWEMNDSNEYIQSRNYSCIAIKFGMFFKMFSLSL